MPAPLPNKLSLLVLSLFVVASTAHAQQDAPAAEPATGAEQEQVVQVSGTRDPQLKPYRQMLKGVDAFDAHHAKLAPQAAMLFELRAGNGTPPVDGLSLNIVGDNVRIPLPLAPDATFTIPRNQAAVDADADMIINRKKDQVMWRPHIRSPGVPDNARRLGDLRLECEMSWAVVRQDMSFVVRNSLSVAGGLCHTGMVALHYAAPRPVKAITMVSGERRQPLQVLKDGQRFRIPLHDGSWNDETLVVYEFADKPAA
jgi:hypothetical protein